MFEKIRNYLNDLEISDLVTIHNNYCKKNHSMDDHIYSMYELDEIEQAGCASDILGHVNKGFDLNHTYFWYDGYGYLSSGDYMPDLPIYTGDIARYIENNDDELDDPEIRDILDGGENNE